MRYLDEERMPRLWDTRNFVIAIGLHAALFGFFWAMGHSWRQKEAVIPIELTFEAPPDEVAPEPDPPPKPQPKPKVEPPPAIKDPKVEALEKVVEKKKPEVKKPEPPKEKPKPEVKKPEPPKKTAKELREERLKRMRDQLKNAKVVQNPKPPPVVGTGKNLEKEWQKLMAQGYKPGEKTQLAASEEQRCISLIREAFYSKWDRPPWSSSLREMILEVRFGAGGKVLGYRLIRSSGDGRADGSVTHAASLVGSVPGLSSEFLAKNSVVQVRFKVTPE